jgi:flagellar basal-body rod modification protein FlgD
MMQVSGVTGQTPSNVLPTTPPIQDPVGNGSASTSITTSSSSSTASSTAEVDTQDFITILSAELQSQDPTDPVDPTSFVTQLAQFNSLDELINIREDIESYFGSSSTSSSGTPTTQNPNQLF